MSKPNGPIICDESLASQIDDFDDNTFDAFVSAVDQCQAEADARVYNGLLTPFYANHGGITLRLEFDHDYGRYVIVSITELNPQPPNGAPKRRRKPARYQRTEARAQDAITPKKKGKGSAHLPVRTIVFEFLSATGGRAPGTGAKGLLQPSVKSSEIAARLSGIRHRLAAGGAEPALSRLARIGSLRLSNAEQGETDTLDVAQSARTWGLRASSELERL